MFGPRPVVLAWVAAVALGLTLGFQGWRARGPDADVVASMVRASALVERFRIPHRGNPTDLNAFRPPGTAWLLVPGVALFDDPRLVEMTATGLLFPLAVAGVLTLAREIFSTRAALIAAAFYAVSAIPINLLGVLQPRAYPAFVVWMTVMLIRWARRRDGRFLAAAFAIGAAGAYVHLEMLPFGLSAVAIAFVRRPPIQWRSLALAAAFAAALWSPYLRFQATRGFIDLRAQLSLRQLDVRGPTVVAPCGEDPEPGVRVVPPARSPAEAVMERAWSIPDFALMNVQSRALGGDFILLSLLASGIAIAVAHGGRMRLAGALPVLLTGIAVSILGSEYVLRWGARDGGAIALASLMLRRVHVWALCALAVAACLDSRILDAARRLRRTWSAGDDASLLAISILVPGCVILALSYSGETRMVGMWPLQVALMAGVVDATLATQARRAVIVPVLVFGIIAANLQLEERLLDWQRHGWAGEERTAGGTSFRDVICEDER